MAFQLIFPPQVLVLKRELLWIPFFGWGLALMSPIAINRSRGVAALRAIARRGRERLQQGFWVVVFPEGTRVAPGASACLPARRRLARLRERRAGGPGGAQRGPRLAAQRVPQAPRHGHRAHRAADRRRQPRPQDRERACQDMDRRTAKSALLIRLGGRDSRVPLRAPAPAHARHHGRCRRPEGLRAAARAVARHRGLRAREGALDPRQAGRMGGRAAARAAARRERGAAAALRRGAGARAARGSGAARGQQASHLESWRPWSNG